MKYQPKDMVRKLTAKGLTQGEIARFAGVSQSTICRIESGTTKTIKYHVAEALLSLLQLTKGASK